MVMSAKREREGWTFGQIMPFEIKNSITSV